jgi:hypothetical protein
MAVRWRLDRGWSGDVVVEVSGGGDWAEVARGSGGVVEIDPAAGVRARQPGGVPSDVYVGSGSDWLVVDGFDRVLDGSWSLPSHDFARRVGATLGSACTASNEAVAQGVVDLSDYAGVVWLLGDESRGDVTFDDAERAALSEYLDRGGRLIASGSEIGYATDATWLSQALHATFVADDAGTTKAGGYTFGVVYEEDWPDVLAGDTTLWTYATGGAAAVGWDHRVVVVGFPLETLADEQLAPAVGELVSWVE